MTDEHSVWTGQLMLTIHAEINQSLTADLDVSFTLRLAFLELLSAAGAGLTIAFNLCVPARSASR